MRKMITGNASAPEGARGSLLGAVRGVLFGVQCRPQRAVHRGAEGFRPEERPNQLTPRIHPHEGTRLPEMAEGLRARLGGGPVRLLLPADLIAQTPIVRGLFTETGQHAVE